MPVCDDCRQAYGGPAYWSFPRKTCREGWLTFSVKPHPECTGNLCPSCAGPYLIPNDPADPRRE